MKAANYWKNILLILSLIVLVIFFLLPPFEGLTEDAMKATGVILMCIILWSIKMWADYIIAMILGISLVVFNITPFDIAFKTFSSSTWWLIFSAFSLGIGMEESGLLNRIAYYLMRKLPKNIKGQSLAVIMSGLIVSPVIPALSGKMALAAKLSLGISKNIGLKDKTDGTAIMFFSIIMGVYISAPLFMTGSIIGMMIYDFSLPHIDINLNITTWFLYTLPGISVAIILFYIYIFRLFNDLPTKDEGALLSNELIADKITLKEKKMAVIIIFTLIGWVTNSIHGLTPSIIGLISVVLMKLTKVLTNEVFRKKMNWNSLIFTGFVLNLRNIVPYLNIDVFIQDHLGNVFESITTNPYVFALSIVLATFILRFFIVSMNALCAMLLTVLVPIAVSANFNPWCMGILIFMASKTLWILPYQNIPINVAHQATDERMMRDEDFRKTSLVYFAINIITMLVLVTYWNLIGIMTLQ